MQINSDRLWSKIYELGKIGADSEGGTSRFSWTKEYQEACLKLKKWMEEVGMNVHFDAVGNLYGRMSGENDSLPAILTGSHLDTVPHGGYFDGALGILSALEALTSIKEQKVHLYRPIEIIAFINEEASQFLGGCFGSKVMCGQIPDNYVDQCIDRNTGMGMHQAILDFGMGLDPNGIKRAIISKDDYCAFIELHIEQGRYLLDQGFPLAIVEGIAGIKQFYIILEGISAHAGGMAMKDRHDCVAAAAKITCEVERLALESSSTTRGTVGYIKAYPGEHNIIAGKVEIPVDYREIRDDLWSRIYNDLIKFTEDICEKRGLRFSIKLTCNIPPCHCDNRLIKLLDECAEREQIPHTHMVSYPAHDAMQMGRLFPMNMIFIRSSNNGVSHCPQEYTEKSDAEMGARLLAEYLITVQNKGVLECRQV